MKDKIICCVVLFLAVSIVRAQDFVKVVADPIVSDGRYSEGAAWADINNDGYLDLFVPDLHLTATNQLFINNQDGSFREVTSGPVVSEIGRTSGGYFGDFDNDGDADLFVANYLYTNNFLYLNDGLGNFTKVVDGDIVNDGSRAFGASIVDYDNDGFLDIYVVNGASSNFGENNFLYRNNGDATFTQITSGPLVEDSAHSSSATWCDYDNDGDSDLFVANGFTEDPTQVGNAFYRNNGDGTFTELALSDIGLWQSYGSNGSWGDYDNDGDFDLYVTNFIGINNHLFSNNGDGTFTRIFSGIAVNDRGDSVSSTWGDYDNDGDLDLYVTNDFNENNVLYRNDDGEFVKVVDGDLVNDGGRSNGAIWGDYDNDGDLDLYVPNGQRPATQNNILYRNDNASGNHWVNIKCVGVASNTSAIGAKVRAKATIDGVERWQLRQVSGSSGFNAQNSPNVEFGFGAAVLIDSLVIEWPSGAVDVYTEVATDSFYQATEGIGLGAVVISIESDQPGISDFALLANYPNPFNPVTTIEYRLDSTSEIELSVFDIQGRPVKKLVAGVQGPGGFRIQWTGVDDGGQQVASGIYYYRLRQGKRAITRSMVLLR